MILYAPSSVQDIFKKKRFIKKYEQEKFMQDSFLGKFNSFLYL